MLIGHKADLEDQRQVSTYEGIQKAKEMGCPFFETSAKTGRNINETMIEVVLLHNKFFGTLENINQSYLSGKDVYKFVKYLHKKEFSKCSIPSINKNTKNIWINIFGLLLRKGESKLNLKLVCKHWYNLISQITFENNSEKAMEKKRDISKY